MGSTRGLELSRRGVLGLAAAGVAAAVAACGSAGPAPGAPAAAAPAPAPPPPVDLAAPAAAVATRATVPVLCWHQLRDWRPDDSAQSRAQYVCPPAMFRAQLDALVAGGFTTIGPDDYLAHLTTGAPLPARPIMLSFDDSQGSQITVGLPELAARRMTATFFVMTVPLGKPNWMTRDDVARLPAAGHTVAAHTYDHDRADRYTDADWDVQLVRPRQELEALVGRPVRHFAYPFGAWKPYDFAHLDAAGYVTAFQLGDRPLDPGRPLLTLRRILMGSVWDGPRLMTEIART